MRLRVSFITGKYIIGLIWVSRNGVSLVGGILEVGMILDGLSFSVIGCINMRFWY